MRIKKAFVSFGLLLALLFSLNMMAFAAENTDDSLTITGRDSTLRVVNGSTVTTAIEIVNTGSIPISDLTLQAELPYKWLLASVTPEKLTLSGGETGTFSLALAVPPSQNAITQTIKLMCGNGTVSSKPLSIPVAVSTDMKYLWFALGGVVVCGLVTAAYFKKHGRR